MYQIYIGIVWSQKIERHSSDQIHKARIVVWCSMNGIYIFCGKIKVQLTTLTLVSKHSNYLMHVSICEFGISDWIWAPYSIFFVHCARNTWHFGKEKKCGLLVRTDDTKFEVQVRDRVSYLFKYLPMGLWLLVLFLFIHRKKVLCDQMPKWERTMVNQCNLQLSKSISNKNSE